MKKTPDALGDQKENNAPMVEIFGGVFALLLVLFLIINVISQATLLERLEANSEEGLYKVNWGGSGSGYTVLTFPGKLRIIETNEAVVQNEICQPHSPFVSYAKKIYSARKQQIIFVLLEGSVTTMAAARNCMLKVMPGRLIHIGWIIANNELLKAVSLDDIPAHIEKVITE